MRFSGFILNKNEIRIILQMTIIEEEWSMEKARLIYHYIISKFYKHVNSSSIFDKIHLYDGNMTDS